MENLYNLGYVVPKLNLLNQVQLDSQLSILDKLDSTQTSSMFQMKNFQGLLVNQSKNLQGLNKKLIFGFGFLRLNSGKSSSYQKTFKRWRIIKGDRVVLITGKDKGKAGTVVRVYRRSNKVLVQGVNQKMRRVRAEPENDAKSGIKAYSHPVHISNVSLIDPETQKPTRIRFGYLEDGTKVRLSQKSGSIIQKIKDPAFQRIVRNKNKIDGVKDTPPLKVHEITYKGEDFQAIKKEFELFIKNKENREKMLVFKE